MVCAVTPLFHSRAFAQASVQCAVIGLCKGTKLFRQMQV